MNDAKASKKKQPYFWGPLLAASCGIVFIRPRETIPILDEKLENHEFSVVIDATRGKLSSRLGSLAATDCATDLWLSRIRRADDGSLSTTGHIVSLSLSEMRERLTQYDFTKTLIIDDTSFSGTTNLTIERRLASAFPERLMDITHGLLIANKGNLGDQPGATQRLDKVITAATMHTPQDDGWHIFDILPAENTAGHLAEVQRALHANDQEWQGLLARNILFPGTHTSVQLRELQNRDHFIASAEMSEGLHMKNPQLLMTMIAQGHIDPPHKWRMPEDEVFTLLQQMAEDLHGGKE